MFNGETVWVADEGLHGNLAYDGDLNMTMNLLNFSEFAEGEEEDWYYWCEETTAEDAEEGQYRCTDDYGHGNQPDGQDVYFWDYYDDCSYDADRTNEDGEAGLYWWTYENDDDEEWSIQDTCEMWFQGTYDEIEDTCSSVREFKTFDVGIEYIYEEYEIESHEYGEVTFVCGNGDEIDFSWVNDGYEDCEDGSDEPQDFDGDGVTDNWFDCNDGSTISMDLVNDGNADCSEGEDEGGDGEWTVSTEIESRYVRYYSDDSYVFIGDMSTEYISMYDVVISIYDEGGNFVDMAYGDDDETTIVFSGLADGKYAAFVSIVDSNGTTVFSSQHGSNFCIGECGHGGNWQTGDASLEFSYDWDDYVEEDCWGTVMLWEESTFLSMGMGGSGDDDHDDHDHGDHDGDHGDHDGDHGDHDGDHGDHDGDHGDH
ncbi:MAG: hypothetical protein CMB49_04635, partial [Euryarchaeota archaeon]|nr:hypothetical protein [Euryarchaeota archaeon]